MNSTRTVLVSTGFCLLLGLLFSAGAFAGTIELTVPDTCAVPGDTLWLPIYTTDVTDSGVIGYDLDVKYDSNFVAIEDVITTGSISEIWGPGNLIWNVIAGEDTLRLANAGVGTPLSGAGILVFIGMRILETAPQDSSAEIIITEAILRDDPQKPPVATHPGLLTIGCNAAIEPGETVGQSLRIQQIGPSTVRWHFESQVDSISDLRIYSARGRLIASIRRNPSENNASYIWTGRDSSGKDVADGIYFYEVKSGSRRWTGKVHIWR